MAADWWKDAAAQIGVLAGLVTVHLGLVTKSLEAQKSARADLQADYDRTCAERDEMRAEFRRRNDLWAELGMEPDEGFLKLQVILKRERANKEIADKEIADKKRAESEKQP